MSEISVINDKRSIFGYHQEKRKELRGHIHLSFREIALPASLQNLVWQNSLHFATMIQFYTPSTVLLKVSLYKCFISIKLLQLLKNPLGFGGMVNHLLCQNIPTCLDFSKSINSTQRILGNHFVLFPFVSLSDSDFNRSLGILLGQGILLIGLIEDVLLGLWAGCGLNFLA